MNGVVPAALANIEGTAEDAYDKALAGDAAAVAADATQLQNDWSSFRAQASDDGAAPTTLKAVDDAIAALAAAAGGTSNPVDLARLANAVSGPMPTLYALYSPVVPTELLELDYRGRELELDGKETDMTGASGDLQKLRATWTTLKPSVLAASGSTQAAEYDASVSAVEGDIAANDAAKLATDAVVGLDLVDAMEGLFK